MKKILIVDDEKDILEFLSYNLKKEGFSIYTASDGSEGLEKTKKIKPDLIIVDLMMPKMNGIEMCENIRNDKKLSNVIILFLTARSEDYTQIAALDSGADDFLKKPIKPKLLISKVKSIMRRFSLNKNLKNYIHKDVDYSSGYFRNDNNSFYKSCRYTNHDRDRIFSLLIFYRTIA